MRHLAYALRFVGRAEPIGAAGAWRISMAAPSALLHVVVGRDGLQSAFTPLPGAAATVTSEVIFTAEQTFLAFGVVQFGEGHRLRFTTVGGGHLGPSADPALRHGAVIWRVEEGEGGLAGASGLIASTFIVDEELSVVDHHVGLLALP